jgi:hypothetical protein
VCNTCKVPVPPVTNRSDRLRDADQLAKLIIDIANDTISAFGGGRIWTGAKAIGESTDSLFALRASRMRKQARTHQRPLLSHLEASLISGPAIQSRCPQRYFMTLATVFSGYFSRESIIDR